MNKKKINKPEQVEQSVSNVRSYFTKEIVEKMSEMGAKEMESVLKAMVSSREWIAILKYISMRTPLLDATLRTTNPTTDPHIISWSQGAMAGLSDMENYIIELNSTKQEVEEENTNESPEGKI